MREFIYTAEGYLEAKQYLIEIGKLSQLENELSADGYTLVALANLYAAEEESETIKEHSK